MELHVNPDFTCNHTELHGNLFEKLLSWKRKQKWKWKKYIDYVIIFAFIYTEITRNYT